MYRYYIIYHIFNFLFCLEYQNTCTSTRYLADCFVQESIKEDENGTVTYEFNTDTIDFLDQYKNLTLCIKPYTNDTYPDINKEVKSSLMIIRVQRSPTTHQILNWTQITLRGKLSVENLTLCVFKGVTSCINF